MVTPYITFNGECKEAMAFYQSIFKGEIKSSFQYGEHVPGGIESPPANLREWIMHAKMEICGVDFWFADETQAVKRGDMIKLSAKVPTATICQEYFAKLKEEGEIVLPPTSTFYSNFHAAVVDKYGVCWHIISDEPPLNQKQ